jgi:hypothetical protein
MKKHFIKSCEKGVSYLALKSTRTIYTITSLNISKTLKKETKLYKRTQ